MIDGIAQIEISDKGNCRLKSLDWVDFRLEVVEFEDAEGLGQIMDQLPKFLSDVLVLVTFEYESNTSQSYEGEWDVEELFLLLRSS